MKLLLKILTFLCLLTACEKKDCEYIELEDESCNGSIMALLYNKGNNQIKPPYNFIKSDITSLNNIEFNDLGPVGESNLLSGEGFAFNFSTINQDSKEYYFDFQYSDGENNQLLKANYNNFTSASVASSKIDYYAPVYLKNTLYAIKIQQDANELKYIIYSIDENTNAKTEIFSEISQSNTTIHNLQFYATSNQVNKLYFLTGHHLFEYDIVLNTAKHIELDDDKNYSGIQYKSINNTLIGIEYYENADISTTHIVEIQLGNNYTINKLLELNGYILGTDGFPFHSTAYSPCLDHYYISTLVDPEAAEIQSYLLEIKLEDLTIQEKAIPGFLFGIELDEN